MRVHRSALIVAAGIFVALWACNAEAIPAFSRKYQTGCSTCHALYPKLNYFGKAFRNNGYRFPRGEDGTATKIPPVLMGADAYRDLFPKALWPSDIPGGFPASIRGISRVRYYEDARTTTFEFPHEFELLTGGTLGDSFSFFGELEIENENNENELGMDLSLQYDPRPGLHVRFGQVVPHPISDHLRLTAAHYSAYDTRTTPSSVTLTAPNPNGSTATLSMRGSTEQDRWRFRSGQAGIEVWGARNGPNDRGGLTWALGLVNGQGVIDANDHKDVFGRVAYKFGGYGELGGGELPQDLEFWRDDSIKVGFFTYTGKSLNVYDAATTVVTGLPGTGLTTVSADSLIENEFTVVGGEFDWWYKDMNVFGLYMRQNDDDPRGTGETIDTDAWFVEGNYTVYPWLVGIVRYGQTSQDFQIRKDPVTQKFFIPGVAFLVRANIKFTLEAQARLDDPGKGSNLYLVGIDWAF